MIQKIKKITAETQRRREKHFFIVNRAAGAVNNKLAFPLCLCASAVQSFDFVFNVSSWLKVCIG
jgi:hypothetical protein